jgi:ABC-type transporter Mla subunit MlaD
MENDVNLVIDLLDKRNKKQIHIAKLNKLFHKIHKINKELKSKSINETLEEDIHFALHLYNTRKTHQQKIDKLNLLINQLIKKSKHLKEIKNKLHQLESKFQNEFPDVCPLCNTKLS